MKMGTINQIVALVYIVFHGLQARANAPDLIKLRSAVAKGAGNPEIAVCCISIFEFIRGFSLR